MKIISDPAAIEPYLADESNAFKAPLECVSKVYLPEGVQDLQSVLRDASTGDIKCTTSGAGTGVTGSRAPMCGGCVISMERMLKTEIPENWEMIEREFPVGAIRIAVSPDRTRARISPGLTLDMLNEVLPKGLFYPPDPTESSAQIGSTVATNASGSRTFYFGPTRDWIEALTVILASGEVLRVRRGEILAGSDGFLRFKTEAGGEYQVPVPTYTMPPVKNAAGLFAKPNMDLIDLFIGSEGILGVFAEIEIRLEKELSDPIADVAFFGSGRDSLEYVNGLRRLENGGIVAIEYFDGHSLAFMRENEARLREEYKAAILIEVLGDHDATLDAVAELSDKYNVLDDWSGPPEQFKEFRHSLPESVNSYLKRHDSHKLGTDFAVPLARFDEMMKAYVAVGEEFQKRFPRAGMHYVLFGHIGDCHLHFNFIAENPDEMAFAKSLYLKLAQKAVELGGTISAEHGVGKKTIELDGRVVPYLALMHGEAGLMQIAAAKRALDPKLILNVGNMLPEALN